MENRKTRKELDKLTALLEKSFTSKNTMPASELRKLSQKKLKKMVEENAVMGVIIKDEMALALIGMKDYERLLDYIGELEEMIEEVTLLKEFGHEILEPSEDDFIEMPENMSVAEYKKWRKEMGI